MVLVGDGPEHRIGAVDGNGRLQHFGIRIAGHNGSPHNFRQLILGVQTDGHEQTQKEKTLFHTTCFQGHSNHKGKPCEEEQERSAVTLWLRKQARTVMNARDLVPPQTV